MSDHPFTVAMRAAGFDPLDPSPECVVATAQPLMSAELTPLDRLGVHACLLCLDGLIRFRKHLRPRGPELAGCLGAYATLHALRAFGVRMPRLKWYEWLTTQLTLWNEERLRPSLDRIDAEPGGLMEHSLSRYEPGLTLCMLQAERGWMDRAGNLEAVRVALRFQEEQGRLKSDLGGRGESTSFIKDLPITEEAVGDLALMLIRERPGSALSYVTDDGRVRLGAEELRDGVNALASRIQPVRDRQQTEEFLDADAETTDEVSVLRKLEALEVLRVIGELREMVTPGSCAAVVLDNFPDLATRELSFRELSRRSGRDREQLSESYKSYLETLRRRLA